MSAQGAILEKRGMRVPIWPVVAALVAAATIGIGVRMIDELRPAGPVTSTREVEGTWNATVGHPVGPRMGAMAPVLDVAAIEGSAAAVRELPAAPFHADGRAHEVVVGAQATPITFATGLENPGAYDRDVQMSPHRRPKYGN